MQTQLEDPVSHRRRSLRRAVQLETDVLSDLWDGVAPFLATNLSPDGLWLQTDLPLEGGEELMVSLIPPRWQSAEPFTALARVARVGMFRRGRDSSQSGMGLEFVDIESGMAELLLHALQGLPPPLPSPRRATLPPPLPKREHNSALPQVAAPTSAVVSAVALPLMAAHLSIAELGRRPQITLADGTTFELRAEAPLLTAGRPAPRSNLIIEVSKVASVIPMRIGSPMSAILHAAPANSIAV